MQPSAPAPSSLIRFRGVTKIYGTGDATVAALKGVDFSIARGEFVAVMGPSGSGKSTAMNILGRLDTPTEGTYEVMGAGVGVSRQPRIFMAVDLPEPLGPITATNSPR